MLGSTGHAAVAAASAGAAPGGVCPLRALQQVFPLGARDDGKAFARSERWTAPPMSKPSSCTPGQYAAIAAEIKAATASGALDAPALLRLSFHTTTIGDAAARGAGSNGGWLAFDEDRLCPANAGLAEAVGTLLEMRAARWPGITHADLFAFAGALSAELAGGPPVAWYPGRLDATGPGPAAPPLSVNVPDALLNAAGVHSHYLRMGLTAREAVLLTGGGHSIGGATPDATGFLGSFTPAGDSWPAPSNKYFIDLMQGEWSPVLVPETGRPQYVLTPKGAAPPPPSDAAVFRLPADMALREADVFSRWAAVYAANEAKFVADFQHAMQRMLQLGAGVTWAVDTSYVWRGFKGDWEGFGPDATPLGDDE
ncbi:MAG: heme peroxidase [Monoraphidium minutum]|nr:MAG: heme peroxidase [Monoraphidium minutum]